MDNLLVESISQSGLEVSEQRSLFNHFEGFFIQATQWQKKSESIVITSREQVAEMKMAREARLAMKNLRVETEKKRKLLKEESLRKGQVIDSIARIVVNTIIPIENYLEEQEKFIERLEAKEREELKAKRLEALAKYDVDTSFVDIVNMPEEVFAQYLATAEKAYNDNIEAVKKAEQERIAKEKAEEAERERIRVENIRLREEAAKKDAKIKEEQAKAKKIAAEKDAKLREEQEKAKKLAAQKDAQIKAEREAYQKTTAEAEAKAKKEAEAKKVLEKELAMEKKKRVLYTCERCGHQATA